MAKRSQQRSKGLRNLTNIPAAVGSDGFFETKAILNHDAPSGAYEIDRVITDMHGAGRILHDVELTELVQHARAIVDASGRRAIEQAQTELALGEVLKTAAFAFKNLETIRYAASSLHQAKPDDIGPLIAREDDVEYIDDLRRAKKSAEFATEVVETLFGKAAALGRDVEAFLNRYDLPKGQGSSKEPLTNNFIFGCASSWHSLTGEWAKRSESAALRRFLIAGWVDLKLPTPSGRDGLPKPLEDHFKDRLAKSDIFEHFRGN